ncbi:hypothetical protein IC582_013893 [Cucumis melo]
MKLNLDVVLITIHLERSWFFQSRRFKMKINLSVLALVVCRSMVNCITLNSTSRVALASCRNAFNMVANLSLYAVALLVFSITKAKSHTDIEYQYRVIAYISIFIGCYFVVIFLVGTKEPSLKVAVQGNRGTRISWSYWFKKVLYYQVSLAYVLTRLIVNVSQVSRLYLFLFSPHIFG